MNRLRTSACLFVLTALMSLSPADAFGGKKKTDSSKVAPAANAAAPEAEAKPNGSTDGVPSLDDVLSQPVKRGPLQGGVEETDADPGSGRALQGNMDTSGGKPLQGNTDASGGNRLNGNANDFGGGTGIPLQPKRDTGVLRGNASVLDGGLSDDPDSQNSDLMVEWDRWRNKFLRSVQMQVQTNVNHPDEWDQTERRQMVYDPQRNVMIEQPRFPLGCQTTFSCEVTSDRKVRKLQVLRSSGYPGYDKAVLDGVKALEDSSLLTYPAGSKRMVVTEAATIRTSTSSDYQYQKFGDVERVPGQ